jgi:hypothetical protein
VEFIICNKEGVVIKISLYFSRYLHRLDIDMYFNIAHSTFVTVNFTVEILMSYDVIIFCRCAAQHLAQYRFLK